jgi:hypothetical protein
MESCSVQVLILAQIWNKVAMFSPPAAQKVSWLDTDGLLAVAGAYSHIMTSLIGLAGAGMTS